MLKKRQFENDDHDDFDDLDDLWSSRSPRSSGSSFSTYLCSQVENDDLDDFDDFDDHQVIEVIEVIVFDLAVLKEILKPNFPLPSSLNFKNCRKFQNRCLFNNTTINKAFVPFGLLSVN